MCLPQTRLTIVSSFLVRLGWRSWAGGWRPSLRKDRRSPELGCILGFKVVVRTIRVTADLDEPFLWSLGRTKYMFVSSFESCTSDGVSEVICFIVIHGLVPFVGMANQTAGGNLRFHGRCLKTILKDAAGEFESMITDEGTSATSVVDEVIENVDSNAEADDLQQDHLWELAFQGILKTILKDAAGEFESMITDEGTSATSVVDEVIENVDSNAEADDLQQDHP
ncbi:hypothetical protein V6N12_060394 [Hibiscus sabdariffa]|uniref:Uncharacterized protein n=1 Tax=Hibiscus sabdariffa TaxID=183260 RepID=A0ABR2D4P6_9ROSI